MVPFKPVLTTSIISQCEILECEDLTSMEVLSHIVNPLQLLDTRQRVFDAVVYNCIASVYSRKPDTSSSIENIKIFSFLLLDGNLFNWHARDKLSHPAKHDLLKPNVNYKQHH